MFSGRGEGYGVQWICASWIKKNGVNAGNRYCCPQHHCQKYIAYLCCYCLQSSGFVMHGTADATVPVQQSLSLVEMLKANNVKHRFVVKPGGGPNPDDIMPEWLEAVNWFREYLK
jgi:hypothetical protein